MNQHLIDWNLERAAEELYWEKIIAHRNRRKPFPHNSEEMEECRYMAGMHIASANALIETRTQIELLDHFSGLAMQTLLGKLNEYPDEHWRVGLAERQKGGAV